jgi:hypothetical protein
MRRTKRGVRKDESWKIEFLLTGQALKPDGSPSIKPFLWLPEHNGCFAAFVKPREPGESDDAYLKRHGLTMT